MPASVDLPFRPPPGRASIAAIRRGNRAPAQSRPVSRREGHRKRLIKKPLWFERTAAAVGRPEPKARFRYRIPSPRSWEGGTKEAWLGIPPSLSEVYIGEASVKVALRPRGLRCRGSVDLFRSRTSPQQVS